MAFIDGFVIPVAKAKREVYLANAKVAAEAFKRYGALRVVENWGDDVPEGKVTSFPMAVKKQPDEAVVLAWVVWPSKEVREAAWKSLESDPVLQAQDMPFDGKRMIYGCFQTILDV
jgi:uncharacterized protein YbaA (DUF1428 family)